MELREAIHYRRTIRAFLPDPVFEETISIEDRDTRGHIEYYAQMYALYDAPALILMMIDKGLPIEYAMLDCGLFLQTLCLLAQERSLGTAILSAAVHCPNVVRRIFEVPQNKLLVVGVAMGKPDTSDPLNNFERKRSPVNEFVRWVK